MICWKISKKVRINHFCQITSKQSGLHDCLLSAELPSQRCNILFRLSFSDRLFLQISSFLEPISSNLYSSFPSSSPLFASFFLFLLAVGVRDGSLRVLFPPLCFIPGATLCFDDPLVSLLPLELIVLTSACKITFPCLFLVFVAVLFIFLLQFCTLKYSLFLV